MLKHIARILVTIVIVGGLGYFGFQYFNNSSDNGYLYNSTLKFSERNNKDDSVFSLLVNLSERNHFGKQSVLAQTEVEYVKEEGTSPTQQEIINATYPTELFGERNNTLYIYESKVVYEDSAVVRVRWKKILSNQKPIQNSGNQAAIYNMRQMVFGVKHINEFIKFFNISGQASAPVSFKMSVSLANVVNVLDQVNLHYLTYTQFANKVSNPNYSNFKIHYENLLKSEERLKERIVYLTGLHDRDLPTVTTAFIEQMELSYKSFFNELQEYIKMYSKYLNEIRSFVTDKIYEGNFVYSTSNIFFNTIIDIARNYSESADFSNVDFKGPLNDTQALNNIYVYEIHFIYKNYLTKVVNNENVGDTDFKLINYYNYITSIKPSLVMGSSAENVFNWSSTDKFKFLSNDSGVNSKVSELYRDKVKYVMQYLGFGEQVS